MITEEPIRGFGRNVITPENPIPFLTTISQGSIARERDARSSRGEDIDPLLA